MNLSDFYPRPGQLIENEVGVLNWLMDDPYIKEVHPTFAQDARIFYERYRNLKGGFQFWSHLEIFHSEMPRRVKPIMGKNQPNLRLFIGSIIERTASNYGNISYSLMVCRLKPKNLALLRKFHFDITSSAVRRQPHPICHLQYCGGVPQFDTGITKAQLENMHMRLSEPRIFFWPMSLALLLDLTLREFPDERSTKFRTSPAWKGIVRENERLLLQPFYEKCVDIIRDNAHNHRSLAEEFYVN